ncbi:MAG TPA: hypothetical protein VGD00_03795 [Solirubrobacteraceae bacterium]
MRTDVHQHLWSEPLLERLEARSELPFVRVERDLTVLYLAGERPYVVDRDGERPERRAALVGDDGLDRALVCLSSPIGIEQLPREQAVPLLDAYHEGALALSDPFGVWGAIALDRAEPGDVDRALARGCVGISLPAGALARIDDFERLRPVLARLERHGAPLFVHPGPGLFRRMQPPGCSLGDPLWWHALTHYVAGLQSAWLAFQAAGRAAHPQLRVVFSMLAGLAPLHAERLAARGGPQATIHDPLTFYETSSYGLQATSMVAMLVGGAQILYGSDRPVVEPRQSEVLDGLDWDLLADGTRRALGAPATATAAATVAVAR